MDGLQLTSNIKAIAAALGLPIAVISNRDKDGWTEALESI